MFVVAGSTHHFRRLRTISTVPQAVFYVVSVGSSAASMMSLLTHMNSSWGSYQGIIGVSSLILLFVKDSDRYQHVHEE